MTWAYSLLSDRVIRSPADLNTCTLPEEHFPVLPHQREMSRSSNEVVESGCADTEFEFSHDRSDAHRQSFHGFGLFPRILNICFISYKRI